MSPAPAATAAPASVSLFDLNAEAMILQGLSLMSHAPGDALAQRQRTHVQVEGREQVLKENDSSQDPPANSEKLYCSTCNQTFPNHQEQREHYKLDWHRFNLKQRLRDKPMVSAQDFEKQSSAGDLSSISGSEDSDSDSEEDMQILDEEKAEFEKKPSRPWGFHPHRVLFQNAQGQFLSAYRCVLGPRQVPPADTEPLLQNLLSGGPRSCVVLMAAAGHFAGAVFQGSEVVAHKTFHRYTVRAKQGTAQGVRDARGGASRSAGASLRHYNEATLNKEVRELLTGPGWAKALATAGTILLRAPRSGRSFFFGGRGPPLQRGDPRLWDIPLATRRPTFQELQRVLYKLTTLHVHGEDPREAARWDSLQTQRKPTKGERKKVLEERRKAHREENAQGHKTDSPEQGSGAEEEDSFQVELELAEVTLGTLDLREFEVLPKRNRKKKKKKERSRDLEATAPQTLPRQPQEAMADPASEGPSLAEATAPGQPELWGVLLAACRAGDVGQLELHLAASPQDPGVVALLSAPLGTDGSTLLHAAAAAGRGSVVRLLLEAGADPTVQDLRTRPPYTVAADKSTRNEFRRFMEKNPDAHDYHKAQVPGPLTSEMEARQATRKRAQQAARRLRDQQQRKQREQEKQEQEEQQRFAALSDREKRALAAERRLAAQLGAPSSQPPGPVVIDARRCWSCGASLQGLIPFHYLDFSFCSTRCLQEHRLRAGKHAS